MSKNDKILFIKYFSSINISKICSDLKIDKSNLYREKCSKKNVDLVFNKILDEINCLLNFIEET